MVKWLALGLSLLANLSTAHAKDYELNVQNLYATCKAPDRSAQWALCIAFISGVGGTMTLTAAIGKKYPENRESYVPFSLCGEPTNAAMVQAFKNWAEKNPREWGETQLAGVIEALSETWPCPSK